jgi:hypothetical protein
VSVDPLIPDAIGAASPDGRHVPSSDVSRLQQMCMSTGLSNNAGNVGAMRGAINIGPNTM